MRRWLVALACGAALALPSTARTAGMLTAGEAMMSTVFEENQSSFAGLGGRVRLHPAALAPGLELIPMMEYWRNKSTVPPYGIEASRKDATLGILAGYTFPNESWKPYLGAGYSVHFLSSEVSAPALGLVDATNSLMKGGLTALGGATFPITDRFSNFIELEYHYIPDYNQLKINWGLGFKL